jgi:hypothetical protein
MSIVVFIDPYYQYTNIWQTHIGDASPTFLETMLSEVAICGKPLRLEKSDDRLINSGVAAVRSTVV